jgi:hypothetical protein
VVALFGDAMGKLAAARGIDCGDPGSESIGSVLTTYVPNPGVFWHGQRRRRLMGMAPRFPAGGQLADG